MYTTFQFGTTAIPYFLVRRSKVKHVKITVELEHGVEIVVPSDFDERQLDGILRQKAPWILQKLGELEQVAEPAPPKALVSGEKFPVTGYLHELIVEERGERAPFVVLREGKLVVTVTTALKPSARAALVRDTLRDWYVHQAEQQLPEQVRLYAGQVGAAPSAVSVLNLDRRWGSCTPTGAIHLHWRLVLAPVAIIDYVAVYELCHLLVPDHSPQFWEQVRMVLPDYVERREWLRVNGRSLMIL
jgi:hypothetical protein